MVGQAQIVGHGETLKLDPYCGTNSARRSGTNSTCNATIGVKLVPTFTIIWYLLLLIKQTQETPTTNK